MQSIRILINDEPHQLDGAADIQTLLTNLNIGVRGTAVEVNGIVVPHERFSQTTLQSGDRLEIVILVGGG